MLISWAHIAGIHLESAVELDRYFIIVRLKVDKERLCRLKVDFDPALADCLVQIIQPSLNTKQYQISFVMLHK
jgi:hypothetical protein